MYLSEFKLQHMLLVGPALTGRKMSFPQSYIIFPFDNISGPFKGPKVSGAQERGEPVPPALPLDITVVWRGGCSRTD